MHSTHDGTVAEAYQVVVLVIIRFIHKQIVVSVLVHDRQPLVRLFDDTEWFILNVTREKRPGGYMFQEEVESLAKA